MSPFGTDLHQHALGKLSRVLGEARARTVLGETLRELRLTRVETVDDLHALAQNLQVRSGFDATVGAMLSVDVAMMRLRERTG